MTTDKISINTSVEAPRTKVWEYYTQPEHITRWNFASADWQCPTASNDMRVGGKFTSRMEAKDGSYGFNFEAVYDEVKKPEKFTYTMTDGRKVNVNFKEKGNKTEVTVAFDAEKENPVDMQRDGWQAILDNFKRYTEDN